MIEGKTVSVGGACCEGLSRIAYVVMAESGACEAAGTQSTFVCTACGDGACGELENACNCPDDCARP